MVVIASVAELEQEEEEENGCMQIEIEFAIIICDGTVLLSLVV